MGSPKVGDLHATTIIAQGRVFTNFRAVSSFRITCALQASKRVFAVWEVISEALAGKTIAWPTLRKASTVTFMKNVYDMPNNSFTRSSRDRITRQIGIGFMTDEFSYKFNLEVGFVRSVWIPSVSSFKYHRPFSWA